MAEFNRASGINGGRSSFREFGLWGAEVGRFLLREALLAIPVPGGFLLKQRLCQRQWASGMDDGAIGRKNLYFSEETACVVL